MTVKVPATSGNIGPGFDVLGLALDYYNELRVKVIGVDASKPLIHIYGEGENSLPRDSKNLVFQVIKKVFVKAKKALPQLEIYCGNQIPLTRGMGSSSAAILSGLLAGNSLAGDVFSKEEILTMATEIEGHPDNVAPALYGGVRASAVYENKVFSAAWPVPSLQVVVVIPSFELSTKKARAVLPKEVPMKDAIANLSAVSLMSVAFQGQPNLLKYILNDRWHEPYRAKLIPGFYSVKKAALKAGAYGVTLSGAGPTMLAFVRPGLGKKVGHAMEKSFARFKVNSTALTLSINKKGALVQ